MARNDHGKPEISSIKSEAFDRRAKNIGTNEVMSEVGKEPGTNEPEQATDDDDLTLAEMRSEALKKIKMKKEGFSVKRDMMKSKIHETDNGGIMAVDDSDFYDFDKDQLEKSFKKGQVWAVYDDDGGMPRHYGLIDKVVSLSPFEVKVSWLDLQNTSNERSECVEKMMFHVSCGNFRVSKKVAINLVNVFSHVADCERTAREVYRIFPRMGSVWAIYSEKPLDMEETVPRDRKEYDIVVLLTSYSEMYGLSMAYLDKVDGYKTVFRRREIGYHAVKWLGKDDIKMFSHQIPARKFSGDEVPEYLRDCWKLDPASLPPESLRVGYTR